MASWRKTVASHKISKTLPRKKHLDLLPTTKFKNVASHKIPKRCLTYSQCCFRFTWLFVWSFVHSSSCQRRGHERLIEMLLKYTAMHLAYIKKYVSAFFQLLVEKQISGKTQQLRLPTTSGQLGKVVGSQHSFVGFLISHHLKYLVRILDLYSVEMFLNVPHIADNHIPLVWTWSKV